MAALQGCAEGEVDAALPPDQTELEVHERVWVDDERATPSIGELVGADERVLETLVWVGPSPGEAAPHRPLLLMAHGYDGDPTKFDAFASDVSAMGYVVAAVRFPVTHYGSGAGYLGPADLVEQPADLALVLDGLLAAVADPGDALYRTFDAERIAVLGHSLGGATVLGWTRYGDGAPEVDVTILVAPAAPLAVVFGAGPRAEGPPTLLVHGTIDELLTPEISVTLNEDLAEPTDLLLLEGVGHSEMLESNEVPAIAARSAAQRAVRGFLAEWLQGAAGAEQLALDALAAEGHGVFD